jgi:phenylpropionate dioxygenase-like ring-hydroxylating dioxygenase large terminal subunit
MSAPVAGAMRDLGESLAQGYTLPASWYTDLSVFTLEKQRIFAHSWQYAGLSETLAGPGAFFTCRAGDVPILVLRDENDSLRAFINVCRHRGSELVLAEHGCRRSIQCHYHAWTYDLDGTLRAAPGSRLEPAFDSARFSLLPAKVDTWGPFVFVNPDEHAPPLRLLLGELPELVAGTGIRLDALHRRVVKTYDIAANWKVVVDNYLECYHCPVAHPSFSDLIDPAGYQVTEYEHFSVQTGSVKESARRGKGVGFDTRGEVEEGFYAYLWPNFTINIYPGPGNVSLNLFIPLATDRTRAIFEYCFADTVSGEDVESFDRFIDQVQREDSVLCESVQRGLSSGYFMQGKLMLSRESALRHFQRLVYRAVAD